MDLTRHFYFRELQLHHHAFRPGSSSIITTTTTTITEPLVIAMTFRHGFAQKLSLWLTRNLVTYQTVGEMAWDAGDLSASPNRLNYEPFPLQLSPVFVNDRINRSVFSILISVFSRTCATIMLISSLKYFSHAHKQCTQGILSLVELGSTVMHTQKLFFKIIPLPFLEVATKEQANFAKATLNLKRRQCSWSAAALSFVVL